MAFPRSMAAGYLWRREFVQEVKTELKKLHDYQGYLSRVRGMVDSLDDFLLLVGRYVTFLDSVD